MKVTRKSSPVAYELLCHLARKLRLARKLAGRFSADEIEAWNAFQIAKTITNEAPTLRVVVWYEPHYGPGERPVDVELRCTVEHAINAQRNYAAAQGHEYLSDDWALDDFLVVHGARIEEVPE